MADVTRILNAIEQGDPRATEELLPLVYEELRLLAARKLSHELPGQTLQSTALVHEAYLRLVGTEDQSWDNRGHFFKAAAEAMRRILIENARRKKGLKHGADWQRVDLVGLEAPFESLPEDLIALDNALSKLVESEPESATLLKLRYFAGMTIKQIAQIEGVRLGTIKSRINRAKMKLRSALKNFKEDDK